MNFKLNVTLPQFKDTPLFIDAYIKRFQKFGASLLSIKFFTLASKLIILMCTGFMFLMGFLMYEIASAVVFPFNFIFQLAATTWIVLVSFISLIILLDVLADYLDIEFDTGNVIRKVLGRGMYPIQCETVAVESPAQ